MAGFRGHLDGMTPDPISRRRLLSLLGASAALPVLASCGSGAQARATVYPVSYSEAEWKKRLTAEQFAILRQHGTERPFTSPLDREKRKGTFVCAADGSALFASATKFDSGTGWPSFWRPIKGSIGTSTDRLLGYARTEVHCARCGGHLGHVFEDGPAPTGLRYCINGDALVFRPA